MIKAFQNQRQFLLIWTRGLLDQLDTRHFDLPLLDDSLPENPMDSPRLSEIEQPPTALRRKYNIDFKVIGQNLKFRFDLLNALHLIRKELHDAEYHDDKSKVLFALKEQTSSFGLQDDINLFNHICKDYEDKNTGWTILKLIFLVLFLKEYPPDKLHSLRIFNLKNLIPSKVVSCLPQPKGPECQQYEAIQIYKNAIGVLNDALLLFQIDKQGLINRKYKLIERIDSEHEDETEIKDQSPINSTDVQMSRRFSRGNARLESASLDTRATDSRWRDFFSPNFEETKDLNKSKSKRQSELAKERNRNRLLNDELEQLKLDNHELICEIKAIQGRLHQKEDETEKERIVLQNQCLMKDHEIHQRDMKVSQLENTIAELEERLEEEKEDRISYHHDSSQFVPITMYENLQFELKSAKQESEDYERKWIEALERIKNLSFPTNMPPLPTHQPLFTPYETARYLEPEEDRMSYTQSVLASQEIQNRIACSRLVEKVERLEMHLKEKDQIIEELTKKYIAKRQYAQSVVALSKNYEKLYKIYLNKSEYQKQAAAKRRPCEWKIILYPLVGLAFVLLLNLL